jgi:hypothetical protein
MICLGGDGELGEQVVDRGDRLELLDDRELRPDLGRGDHLEPFAGAVTTPSGWSR